MLSEPCPYVACLVADGDRVGTAIDALASADAHREFSRKLAKFAGEARRIVEEKHRGSLVYAGGDDVLAFLPLPEALACADALRQRFATVMASTGATSKPTLSVGIGIGHVMEGMGDLLALGREAERVAKGADGRDSRNALAVVIDKRSGGRREWRARWVDGPVTRLLDDAKILEERLSSRKVYEIARTLARLPQKGEKVSSEWTRVLAFEVRRSLSRTHAGDSGVNPKDVWLSLAEDSDYVALHDAVSSWVDRMLIARMFAAAIPRVRRRKEEEAA